MDTNTAAVGLLVPSMWFHYDHGERNALWSRIGAAGIDHLAVGDHVSFITGTGFDGLTRLAAAMESLYATPFERFERYSPGPTSSRPARRATSTRLPCPCACAPRPSNVPRASGWPGARCGSGPPLVFTPGWLSNLDAFSDGADPRGRLVATLAPVHLRQRSGAVRRSRRDAIDAHPRAVIVGGSARGCWPASSSRASRR